MRNLIREKRRVTFEKKRITPQTIRSFANIIENEINNLSKSDEKTFYIMYSIDAIDNSSYESQSAEIFKEEGIIESKVIKKITMRFNTIDNSKNIEIQIMHTQVNNNTENFILVSGSESVWVNGILGIFTDILKNIEPQSKYSESLGFPLFITWFVFIFFYFRAFYEDMERLLYTWLRIFFVVGLPILSIVLFFTLHDYLNSLWPSIELQTGKEYQQLPSKKRKIMSYWMVAVVIPILLEILYYILNKVL